MSNRNDLNGDHGFETQLREKMNELSASVDCFDKISARAFPENDSDFSDSEFTVSDLENITGRHKARSLLKWGSIAAAAAVCICVLPKTVFVRDFMSEIGEDGDSKYNSLVTEILSETTKNSYSVCDVPLDKYIEYNILVDPLYDCPFGKSDKTDVKVRLFTRTYNDIETNQIYAIEYSGDYSDGYFLAAAASGAVFTDSELSAVADNAVWGDMSEKNYKAVCSSFTADKYGATVDKNDKEQKVTPVASYEKKQIFKLNEKVMLLSTDVIYSSLEHPDRYGYDISCCKNVNGEFVSVDLPRADKLWKYSINFDGTSALPQESGSYFIRKNYYSQPQVSDEYNTINCFEPYSLIDEKNRDNCIQSMQVRENLFGTIYTPASAYLKESFRSYQTLMYYYYSSDSEPKIQVGIDGPANNVSFGVNKSDMLYNEQNE